MTQCTHMKMSMHAQRYTQPLRHSYVPPTLSHTVYTGCIPTHAQVASYDAHTLQKNMQRFACLSCDSQMVGFSHWATI